jgi:hypothetical protein
VQAASPTAASSSVQRTLERLFPQVAMCNNTRMNVHSHYADDPHRKQGEVG